MADMKKIQEILMNSIFDVYEKMFFVFLEPMDDAVKYDMAASIRFSGVFNGEIHAYLNTDMARNMVENMLGLEPPEISVKQMEDCAKESINMICGSFLERLSPQAVFDLSVPEGELKSGVFKKDDPGTLNLAFDSDGQLLGITLSIKSSK